MVPITISIQAMSRVFDHSIIAKKAAKAPVVNRVTIYRISPVSIFFSMGFLGNYCKGGNDGALLFFLHITRYLYERFRSKERVAIIPLVVFVV